MYIQLNCCLLISLLNYGAPIGRNVEKSGWFDNYDPFFHSLQRLYFHPVIEDAWEESRRELMKGVANGVILAGDGRMDSPGHSAQFCTYSLMDHDRKCVLSMQCIDVRQAKHSNDMERVGLLKAIDDLRRLGVKIGEVVTDGHIQIKHMMSRYFLNWKGI